VSSPLTRVDSRPTPTLLDDGMRIRCEGFKLAYADFLLRWGMLGARTRLLKTSFVEKVQKHARDPADIGNGEFGFYPTDDSLRDLRHGPGKMPSMWKTASPSSLRVLSTDYQRSVGVVLR
jgi:hypothetical protein